MAPKVSDIKFEEAYEQMLAEFKERTNGEYDGRRRIEFFFTEDREDKRPWSERPSYMQINWAAIGTVAPEKAAEFGKALAIAAELAENFIYNGCKLYYED